MSSQNFSAAGAVDLSALAARAQSAAPAEAGSPAGGLVVDVTEQTFEAEVLERSMTVPVVIDFWADWCQPCKQLSPVLERLVAAYGGRLVLAKIDADANQRLAAAAQIQSLPTVLGVLKGQLVPLFMGALPEADVKRYLDELLKVAEANGVTGTVEAGAAGDVPADEVPQEPVADPKYAAADEALGNGDLAGAIAAYEKILASEPGDEIATAGLQRARLLDRTQRLDVQQVRDAAAQNPADVALQCDAADLDVYHGNVDDAFARLITTVKRVSGDDRDRVRQHLLELFTAVGTKDPRVAQARRALASALF